MKKKEIEPIKDKYIYQRYKGKITKYIVREDFECYIEVSTGFTTNIKSIFRGKTSENITNLIEYGDVLKIKEDNSIAYLGLTKPETTITLEDIIEAIKRGKIELLEIVTHEQYSQNSYKVED